MPQAAYKTGDALWFRGVCDELEMKIRIWDGAYWYGNVHSTRKWCDPKDGHVIDKPTRMAHEIPFRELELDHLVRIVESLQPNTPMVEELKEVKKLWKYGKPVRGYRYAKSYWSKIVLPQGAHRVVTMAFYPEHVKEILAILVEAKTGKKVATIETSVAAKKQEGKDLFEE